MSVPRFLIHVAGPMADDAIQRCSACDLVLRDFSLSPQVTTSDGRSVWTDAGYPEGAFILTSMTDQSNVDCEAGPHRATCVDLIDELTFSSYRAQRRLSPHVTPARWARIYPRQPELEARYQNEGAFESLRAVRAALDAAFGGAK